MGVRRREFWGVVLADCSVPTITTTQEGDCPLCLMSVFLIDRFNSVWCIVARSGWCGGGDSEFN